MILTVELHQHDCPLLCLFAAQRTSLGFWEICFNMPPPPFYIPAVFFVLVNIKDIREVGNHFASSLVKFSALLLK